MFYMIIVTRAYIDVWFSSNCGLCFLKGLHRRMRLYPFISSRSVRLELFTYDWLADTLKMLKMCLILHLKY